MLSEQANDDKLQEPLIKWVFSTVRGSGWPRVNVMSIQVLLISSLEWWPSATADGTEYPLDQSFLKHIGQLVSNSVVLTVTFDSEKVQSACPMRWVSDQFFGLVADFISLK